MLVTLEGYNDYNDEILGKFGMKKFKKLKKSKAFKVVKKASKSKIGRIALDAAAMSMGVPIPPSVLMKMAKKAKGLVKTASPILKAVAGIAAAKAGIELPEGLSPVETDAYVAETQPAETQLSFANAKESALNYAASRITENAAKKQYSPEPEKWTPAQIQ